MASTKYRATLTLAILSSLTTVLTYAPPAYAVLGGNVGSVIQEHTQSKASVRILENAGYTVHKLLTPSGTTVNEYADVEGKIFAVTWSGPLMPDLRELLGAYFPVYIADNGERTSGHTRRSVHQDDLVVHSGGRMRAFSGKAYLQSAVPNGVQIDALQ